MSDSFVTLWTVAHQAPLPKGFSREERWSGSPLPSPGEPPDAGIEATFPALQVGSLPLNHPGSPYTDSIALNVAQNMPVYIAPS